MQGVRLIHSTLRRLRRSHGEGMSKVMQSVKVYQPIGIIGNHDTHVITGNSG